MLCALCVCILQGAVKEGDHHASFKDLTLAAESGCRICKGLCRFREDYGHDEVGELCTNPFIRFRFYHFRGRNPTILFFSEATWLKENALPFREISLYISEPEPTPEWLPKFFEKAKADLLIAPWRAQEDKYPRRHIPSSTGDPKVLQLALEWLRSCESNHGNCSKIEQAPEAERYYPPRLLDIAPSDPDIYHLLDVENTSMDGSGYVTLSYCWGTNPSFLTLTSGNLTELKHGIQASSLPQAFLDSIRISRQLGFRYIWIDSLCVLQSGVGSEADWQMHSATMDLIYANCDLNVALDWAENAEQGAFVDRDAEFLQPTFIHVPLSTDFSHEQDILSSNKTSSSPSHIEQPTPLDEEHVINVKDATYARESKLVTIFVGTYDFSSALWKLPLRKRGWVFQERLMAPRTIHFGKDRIYWECYEKFHDEYLPWGIPESGALFDEHYQRSFSLPRVVASPPEEQLPEEEVAQLHVNWHSLTADYSETDLTYPSKDKLVAIAALAKKFSRVIRSPYEAGLFHSDLPLGLLWNQLSPKLVRPCNGNEWLGEEGWQEEVVPDSQRSSTYRAPTWSWASVDKRVDFYISDSGYGDLHWSHESREVLASVVRVRKGLADQKNPCGQLVSADIAIKAPISELRPFEEGPEGFRSNPGMDNETARIFALHIFQINHQNHFKKDGGRHPSIYGLVLSSRDLITYRRIGSYHCKGPTGSQYPADRFKIATVTIV